MNKNTLTHQALREQFWRDIAVAAASSPIATYPVDPINWADTILSAYDERFPAPIEEDPVAESSPPTDDLTLRILPIPEGLPSLPDAPPGHTFVGRGEFPLLDIDVEDRYVFYAVYGEAKWHPTRRFSQKLFHIELVPTPPSTTPEPFPDVPF
jgi:hypothetical protein